MNEKYICAVILTQYLFLDLVPSPPCLNLLHFLSEPYLLALVFLNFCLILDDADAGLAFCAAWCCCLSCLPVAQGRPTVHKNLYSILLNECKVYNTNIQI